MRTGGREIEFTFLMGVGGGSRICSAWSSIKPPHCTKGTQVQDFWALSPKFKCLIHLVKQTLKHTEIIFKNYIYTYLNYNLFMAFLTELLYLLDLKTCLFWQNKSESAKIHKATQWYFAKKQYTSGVCTTNQETRMFETEEKDVDRKFFTSICFHSETPLSSRYYISFFVI